MGSFHTARSEQVAWREVDDEVIILDNRSNLYLSLNGSGARLWRALVRGCTTDDLVRLLQDAYDLDQDRAKADVEAFLTALEAQELLGP